MKRITCLILLLCLLLFACGQVQPIGTNENPPETTTTQATTTEPYVPEIEHTITQRIHPNMPEFTFTALGQLVYSQVWGWTFDMEGVEITGEGFSQRIEKSLEVFVAACRKIAHYTSIGRARTVYTYENGEFVQVERWSTANQFNNTWKTWHYERINGEMVLVRTEVETIE